VNVSQPPILLDADPERRGDIGGAIVVGETVSEPRAGVPAPPSAKLLFGFGAVGIAGSPIAMVGMIGRTRRPPHVVGVTKLRELLTKVLVADLSTAILARDDGLVVAQSLSNEVLVGAGVLLQEFEQAKRAFR